MQDVQVILARLLSALQIIFLFFFQENNLRKALIPFIGVSLMFRAAAGWRLGGCISRKNAFL
jgi:hypothetical protein